MEYLIASLLAASTVNVSSLGPGLWNFDLLVSSFHCPAQGSAAAFLSWANASDHPSKSPNRTSFFVMVSLPAPDFLLRNPLHVSGGRARCQGCNIDRRGGSSARELVISPKRRLAAGKIVCVREQCNE